MLEGAGDARKEDGPYAYGAVAARMRAAGFLWDEIVAGYARDFAARGVTIAHLAFDARGHTHGKQQEVLLFPPQSAFIDSRLGRSRVPEEAFNHLLLFISQERAGAELDPSAEGTEAARAALAAFNPTEAPQEALPTARVRDAAAAASADACGAVGGVASGSRPPQDAAKVG